MHWKDHADTAKVLSAAKQAADRADQNVSSKSSTPYPTVGSVCETTPSRTALKILHSAEAHYVRRSADFKLENFLARQETTATIKAPRQMGKGQFLERAAKIARSSGRKVAFIDCQGLGLNYIDSDPWNFYKLLLDTIAYEIDFTISWPPLGFLSPPQYCRRVMERQILPACDEGLLIILDEADALRTKPYSSDFFAMLRSWHNERAFKQAWRNYSIIISVVSNPHLLIEGVCQSPFNVGTVINLTDFTFSETMQLNDAYGAPLSKEEMDGIYSKIGGHPSLTAQSISHVASGILSSYELLNSPLVEHPIFGDHLRALCIRLRKQPDLLAPLAQALKTGVCDHAAQQTLTDEGILVLTQSGLEPRYPIYTPFLHDWLDTIRLASTNEGF